MSDDEAYFPLFGSKVTKPIGCRHATIHKDVAAGDGGAVRTHEECPNSPNLIWSACASSRRYLKHAPIAWTARPLQLIVRERSDDDAGANRVDPGAALSPTDCLGHPCATSRRTSWSKSNKTETRLTVNSPLRAMRTLSVVRTGLGWVAVQQRSTIEERTVERPFRACLQFFSFFLWLASSISADPRSSSGSVGTALSVTVGSSHTCMTLFPTQIRQGLASLGPL